MVIVAMAAPKSAPFTHDQQKDSVFSFAKPQSEEKKKMSAFRSLANLRKRKRRGQDSNATISESDISDENSILEESTFDLDSSVISLEHALDTCAPESKRSRRVGSSSSSLSRVTSFASVLAPMTRMGQVLTRSLSSAKMNTTPTALHRNHNQHQHHGAAGANSSGKAQSMTPTRLFGRSMSTAHVSASANGSLVNNGKQPSPYGTLKRGAPGRGSATHLTPYKPPQPTPNKQRPTRFWSSQYADTCTTLNKQEVKLQEAIYEMTCGEQDLVEDLQLVMKTYADSLLHLNILSAQEVDLVFGRLKAIIPLHSELHLELYSLRNTHSGVSEPIGPAVASWVQKLRAPYVDYCAGLIQTKAFLDIRRETDKEFADFLIRCLESPFSRKLDLWSYLDVPRSRLVKYPLLLKQVLKFADNEQECATLSSAVQHLEGILHAVDAAMAQARCKHTLARLDWLHEAVLPEASVEAVRNATEEVLEGVLRNNRGTKLECHLLNTVLILGRPSSRGAGGVKRLQVHRAPIPVVQLVVEDLESATIIGSGSSNSSNGKHGSFKAAFSSSQPAKHSFKVSFRNELTSNGSVASGLDEMEFKGAKSSHRDQNAHTLIAPDEHSKRQWMASLQKAVDHFYAEKPNGHGNGLADCLEEPDSAATAAACSSGGRASLFQRKRSPRIKPSLSHAAILNLKHGSSNGTTVKKIRQSLSASSVSSMGLVNTALPNELMVKSAQKKRRSSTSVEAAPIETLPSMYRSRTKSWSHLHRQSVEGDCDDGRQSTAPRYLTRSAAKKTSKSMSDLMKV